MVLILLLTDVIAMIGYCVMSVLILKELRKLNNSSPVFPNFEK